MRPWERLPVRPVGLLVRAWSRLPAAVRRPLVPIGRLVNPHSVTSAPAGPGVETVPGVQALVAAGWVPLETMTGLLRVGEVWPDDYRRSVPDTRDADSTVWLVRSPWPGMSVRGALNTVWSAMERDGRDREFTEEQRFAEMRRLLRLAEDEVRRLT